MTMAKTSRIVLLLSIFGLMTSQSRANVTTYVGEDLQPNPGPTVRTNADAAAASFSAAASTIGPVGTITFESAPLGTFTNLAAATGVTVNGADANGSAQTIRNTSQFPAEPSVDGSNTTASGSQFLEMSGGTLTFTFQTPTQFFGVYLTGVQTVFFNDSISFNDGTAETISLQGTGTTSSQGEIAFIGFTTTGAPVTSITINAGTSSAGYDDIGVDDVSYRTAASSASAPEPGSMTLLLPAMGAFGLILRKRRRRRVIVPGV